MKRGSRCISLLLTVVLVLGRILPPAAHAAAQLPVAQTADLFATATSSVRNDTPYIQGLIDAAVAAGQREVTTPRTNPADGTSVYQIGSAIELPSNITVMVDNCTLRLNDGADATGWEDNISRDVVTNQGTLEGKSRTASGWPLVATGEALQVITPEFQTNTDDYDHIRASLVALNNGYDPSLEKLTLHYSMNNGGSWVSVPLTIAEHGPLWKTSSGSSSFYVSSFTSDALCPDLNVRVPITNMTIHYQDNVEG